MAREKNNKSGGGNNDSGLNFEAQLWAAADKMRGHTTERFQLALLRPIFLAGQNLMHRFT